MLPCEMKEYCDNLQSFEIKASVRLKSESKTMIGRVTGTDINTFTFQTTTQDDPLSLRYVAVANITSAN